MSKSHKKTVTLTDLELIYILRAYVDLRCDAMGYQTHDEWGQTLAARPDDEEAFLVNLAELRERDSLRSLTATKQFVEAVLANKVLNGTPA